MTAHDDIAEVRASFEKLRSAGRTSDILKVWCDDGTDALDRVEAEIARLTELNSGLTRDFNAMLVEQSKQRNRAEAAEREAGKWRARAFSERREVARLRERLRHSNALLEQAIEHMEFAHYPQTGDGTHLADPFDLMEKARALLAALVDTLPPKRPRTRPCEMCRWPDGYPRWEDSA